MVLDLEKVFITLRTLFQEPTTKNIILAVKAKQVSLIKKIDRKQLMFCLKADYLLIKNLILIGKIDPAVHKDFWRRATPDGVPLYLKALVLHIPNLRD